MPLHVAKKKIDALDANGELTKVDGIKLEAFIFDVFDLAKRVSCSDSFVRLFVCSHTHSRLAVGYASVSRS